MNTDYGSLEQRINHTFADPALLELALTHRSYQKISNERLEFLGDSILGMLISHMLYQRFPTASEGDLSQLRSALVKGEALAALAVEFDLGKYLRLGAGELKSGGPRRASILADALEAVIGAIYLDGGVAACGDCVQLWFAERLEKLSVGELNKDAKTRLQEYLQKYGRELPLYEVVEISGEQHARAFTVQCSLLDADYRTKAEAGTRKKAERKAAQKLLALLLEAEKPVRVAGKVAQVVQNNDG